MSYEVIVTSEAEKDFDRCLYYLVYVKMNSQAAAHLIKDFEDTVNSLSEVAGSLKLCENPKLQRLGYRRMNFLSMNYFMLYRIKEETAIVDAVFHGLQDYEHKIK